MNTKLIIFLLSLSAAMPACVFTLSTADGAEEKYHRPDFEYNGHDMWPDVDRDCQDLRQELLIETSLRPVKFKTKKRCRVKKGRWYDHYTDTSYTDPGALEVDHIVPLKWAHANGASRWSSAKKVRFATDPLNLILVKAEENSSKGSKGPAEWMPPNEAYHSEYLFRWDRVLTKYDLRLGIME